MPAKLEEIEGRFVKEFFRRDSFMLGNIELDGKLLPIKGECDPEELHSRTHYRFYGRFAEYKGERQFAFQTFVPCVAHDKDGVIEYLARAGAGLGMGRGTARKCWETFGTDAVREIRQAPRLLRDINQRITADQCDQIGDILKQQKATEDATIELTNLLAGRGFPKTTTRKAIKKWGNKAAMIIRRDPYSLMNFRGCGFKLCDALYIELGHHPARLKRQALCAWYTVASNSDGHTWHPVQNVAASIQQLIGSTNANPKRAIQLALRLAKRSPNHYGALAAIKSDGRDGPITSEGESIWIAEGRRAEAERDLASMVASAVGERGELLWPDPQSLSITDHQKDELATAISRRVGILAGGAGCGKTFTVARVIHALLKAGIGANMIGIAGPTGKSAVRVTEMMQASGLNLKATTIHSMLGVGQSDEEGGEWGFLHGKHNPLPYSVIVIDEASMVDTALMRSLFAARARGCHVLLVGDPAQLPPVGNGAPLRDMIRCGVVGFGELKEIKRTDNQIAFTCQAIRNGQAWEANDDVIVTNSAKDQIGQVVESLRDARTKKLDPVWDCQVLVAVNTKSPLCRKKVNEELQSVLNPNPEVKGTPFRLADKIVCLKNGRYREVDSDADDDEVYVANGELGKVIEIEDKAIIAELWNPDRTIRIPRGKADGDSSGCNWDLAYGLSVHKFQGSEVPICITLIDEYAGAKRICDRSWAYTAVSRAKLQCILVGKKATLDSMCRRVSIGKRQTFLRQLIQRDHARRVLEVM